jgi:hypothetical protein
LRQLREPTQRPLRRTEQSLATAQDEAEGLPREGLYELFEGDIERSEPNEHELYIGSVRASEPGEAWSAGSDRTGELPSSLLDDEAASLLSARSRPVRDEESAGAVLTSGELKVTRALEVFNAGEQPRRVAGVARSLGAPTVTVRPLEQSGGTVAIVVAWELCWYRYEVDLGDEAAGSRLVAQGMELDELPDEDKLANAAADERGELSPLRL